MTKFRQEQDFLGKGEVPIGAYYGIQTLRAVENFPITGYKLDPQLIKAMAIVKKAAAIANCETGRLYKDKVEVISQASDEIIAGNLHDHFVVDPIQGGAGTSINMNTNEVIANRGLELLGKEKGEYFYLNPNMDVNMSQSTNDVFPTAIRLSTYKALDSLLKTMKEMREVFNRKSIEFDPIIKMGRTHLQDAVPIRLGQEFRAYTNVIERDIQRIEKTKKSLLIVNMGATAVGTGLNADPRYIKNVVKHLADISGIPVVSADNLVDATQNTDYYQEVSSVLKICMVNLSKIANDIRLMASGPRGGLYEIILPARQPGSSIMPGKVNPVIPEVINQIAYQVIGNDHTISLASEAGQFELNVMEPVLLFNMLQSISIMSNGFRVFTEYCVSGIKANEKRLKEYVEDSVGLLTAVNPHIGYNVASSIARECIINGKSIRELCLLYNVLTQEELAIILDSYEMTKPGISGISLLEK